MRSSPDDAAQRRQLIVEAGARGRLDAWLAARLPELSRSRVAQLLAHGHITVNGAQPRKSHPVAEGDVVEVVLPAPRPLALAPEPIPVRIVYEDADLLVIDKAAGMVVHPAPGHGTGTLVHALLHHVPDLAGIGGALRPGIVHRLDRDTSGLMVVAKNDLAHRALAAALKRREVRRVYTAAVWGHLPTDRMSVDAPIGRAPNERTRMAVLPHGRPARTHLHRLERWPAADLLRAELDTGRTHQIRVHLAHIGHPVVGDATYGGGGARRISGPAQRWARELSRRVHRQFLHAAELRFVQPRTGQTLEFTAPLPADLADAVAWAQATSSGR